MRVLAAVAVAFTEAVVRLSQIEAQFEVLFRKDSGDNSMNWTRSQMSPFNRGDVSPWLKGLDVLAQGGRLLSSARTEGTVFPTRDPT
jgi:hypothetical protein